MKFLQSSEGKSCVESCDERETRAIGAALGHHAYAGLLILLRGALGMGKTRLAQGVGQALGMGRIKSPTFIIMNEHDGSLPLLHVDLYRLDKEEEIDSLGIEEYLDDGYVAVVEWAEKWRYPPHGERIDVDMQPTLDGSRLLTFTAYGAESRRALAESIQELEKIVEERK